MGCGVCLWVGKQVGVEERKNAKIEATEAGEKQRTLKYFVQSCFYSKCFLNESSNLKKIGCGCHWAQKVIARELTE